MPLPDDSLPPLLRKRLDRWLARWGTPFLSRSLRIEWSPRLRRSFGRCYQDERLIRLAPSLRDSQSFLLAEILCHEAAHAAVYEIHGSSAHPHGPEWEAFMRKAGFEPRVRIPVVVHSRRGDTSGDRVIRSSPRMDVRHQAAAAGRSAGRSNRAKTRPARARRRS